MIELKTTAPGWRDLIAIRILLSDSGLLAAIADQPRGLFVTGRSLGEVLSRITGSLYDLRDAGAEMPRLKEVDLS